MSSSTAIAIAITDDTTKPKARTLRLVTGPLDPDTLSLVRAEIAKEGATKTAAKYDLALHTLLRAAAGADLRCATRDFFIRRFRPSNADSNTSR